MNYEGMFHEALEMFNNGDKEEAAALFEQVARATDNEAAMENAIRAYYIVSIADKGMAKQGIVDEELSLENVDKAIDLLEYGFEKEILAWDEYSNYLKESCAIKGFILYKLNKPECMEWLFKGAKMGDNQSRLYELYYLYDIMDALDENSDEYKNIVSDMLVIGEEYVRYYNPEDTESSDVQAVCKLLAGLFSNVDTAKSQQYFEMANNYDPQTRTIVERGSKPEKKKGLFGFRK